MRHLITGGSGFIGNLVANRLSSRGEAVRVLDVWSDPLRSPELEFVQGNVLNREAVAAAMRGIDVVHHNAALVAQSDAGRHYWDVNVEGTRIVGEEAAKARVKAIIHLSTTAVYGIPPAGAITEATPLRPVETYGRSKLAGETLLRNLCEKHRIPLLTIRPRVTLGAGRLGIFQILFEWIRESRNVYVIGDGTNRMQFIHADDLMEFYMLALASGLQGAYNVGTDRFGTLGDELENLVRYAGGGSKVRHLPSAIAVNALRLLYHAGLSPLVPWHYLTYHRDCYFDTQPLLKLGWKPRYSNAEMLRESYDWYCRQAETKISVNGSPHRSPLGQRALRLVKHLW